MKNYKDNVNLLLVIAVSVLVVIVSAFFAFAVLSEDNSSCEDALKYADEAFVLSGDFAGATQNFIDGVLYNDVSLISQASSEFDRVNTALKPVANNYLAAKKDCLN